MRAEIAHDPGRADAVSVRRQAARGHDRHRSDAAAGVGICRRATSTTRSSQQNVDPALGHREDRRQRVPDRDGVDARDASTRSARCRSRRSTAAPCTSATSRTCATAASPQTNMVHVEGRRSVLMAILKNGDASTLDVIDAVKAAMPERARAPAHRSARPPHGQDAVRPVGVRARVDRGRGARGGRRRGC